MVSKEGLESKIIINGSSDGTTWRDHLCIAFQCRRVGLYIGPMEAGIGSTGLVQHSTEPGRRDVLRSTIVDSACLPTGVATLRVQIPVCGHVFPHL